MEICYYYTLYELYVNKLYNSKKRRVIPCFHAHNITHRQKYIHIQLCPFAIIKICTRQNCSFDHNFTIINMYNFMYIGQGKYYGHILTINETIRKIYTKAVYNVSDERPIISMTLKTEHTESKEQIDRSRDRSHRSLKSYSRDKKYGRFCITHTLQSILKNKFECPNRKKEHDDLFSHIQMCPVLFVTGECKNTGCLLSHSFKRICYNKVSIRDKQYIVANTIIDRFNKYVNCNFNIRNVN